MTTPASPHEPPADRYEVRLAAIVADPEADAPRHALAASLRRTEPELATFIELQLARAAQQRKIGSLDSAMLPADERALAARHAAAWTRGIARFVARAADGAPSCTFHRGLVAQVTVDPDVFVEHAARLLAQAPIRHVDFTPVPADALARLLACDALGQLDSVGFAGAGLDDDAVAAIAACPHLTRCLYLDLSLNPLSPRAFASLAASPSLRQLLVVERAPRDGVDPALTWHPGEQVITRISASGSRASLRPIDEAGHALEAAHGELAWLHLGNRVSRLDARWAVDHGRRPVREAAG